MDVSILVITCIIHLALGIFILTNEPRKGIARSFAVISLVICLWIICNYITALHVDNILINNIANRLAFISSYGTVLAGLIFTYYFPMKRIAVRSEIVVIGLISTVVILLSTTSLIAGAVTYGIDGQLTFSTGELVWLYVLGFLILLFFIARNLLFYSSRWTRLHITQARLVLAAFLVTGSLGLLFNVIIPVFSNTWQTAQLTPVISIILVSIIMYAVARHGLFNIRLVVVRTAAYILALGTLTGIYFVCAYLVSSILIGNQANFIIESPINIGMALILAFIFQPIKRFFDHLTNRIFYRNAYDAEEFFTRFSRKLSTITDLKILLEYTSSEISKTLNASFGAVLVYREEGKVAFASTDNKFKRLPADDTAVLDEYVKNYGNRIIITNNLYGSEQTRLHRLLVSHKISLLMPIVQADSITGYLFLGEYLGSKYTNRDIKTLMTIVDELIIAIQNAVSVQEIRELNAHLEQRVDAATKELRRSNIQLQKLDEAKDDFISIASHQLRTPLTSIKGYISMMIEGDIGKITPEQKHILNEAFISSERMVSLIGDFLNVSRLQTGKFIIDKHPVDLAKLVQREIDSLQTNAQARDITFVYKIPKNIPTLELDENKIQQVIMNFSDNAIYYSKEKGKVTVSLKKIPGWVEFLVKDDGIGVPEAEQAHLFGKFFRATNARRARPDGTGVGLFLAKKVIDDHDGEMVFHSKEGKGSTFGFRLPLKTK